MSRKNKESLDKLLSFIVEICNDDDNKWFRDGLINELGVNEKRAQLSNIEKYLKLDGYKIIDYSHISNENVRNQLFRDCIEMSKYRLGKINDVINFDEFCRYAYLQVEELINYFYNEKFDENLTEISKFIKKHNPKFKPEYAGSLDKISSFYKTTAIFKEHDLNNTTMKRTIDFLRTIRNDLSHRNSFATKSEDLILSSAAEKKMDIAKSYFDFRNASQSDKDLFNQGRFIYLKRTQNYKEVIESLKYLSETIEIITV